MSKGQTNYIFKVMQLKLFKLYFGQRLEKCLQRTAQPPA